MLKFPTLWGIETLVSQTEIVYECRTTGKRQTVEKPPKAAKAQEKVSVAEEVLINPTYPDQLVKKVDGTWRICIDFKNINSACPKDYYPLPEIDLKIDLVTGFPLKYFLDAYKGYHQVQMAEEDEEKTAFYTEQGTLCYTKIPFGLKHAGATYQRLVDAAFQTQIGRNLEAYVDDIVVKSKTEREMTADVVETFESLRRICWSSQLIGIQIVQLELRLGKTPSRSFRPLKSAEHFWQI
ncbi:reverse transcriptase domain-containing protein [Tanacetum coccineum]